MSKVYLKYLLMILFVVPLLCLGFSVNAQDDCYVSLSSNATTLNCNYQEVIIIASGSDDSMTYEWSNAETSDRIMASASGVYYVTATTTNGCTASASIAITEDYSVPQVTITSISGTTTLTCSETEITIMAEGGSSYFWSDGSSSSEITVTNPGLYMVTANGENGCTVTASIDIIGSTESPSVYVSGENSLCSGQIAMLTASAMGGMSPYNYIWSDGSNGETANLSAGSYGVTVTDSNGCTASRQITLEESSPIMLSINGSSTICAGEDVELTAMAIGGTPDYRYAWSSGENNPSIIVAPTLTTTYIVTATDANGCYAEQDITITVSVPLTISLNSESFILTCSNPSANIEATVSEGTAPYLYTWSNGETSSSIMANAAGMYLVTATDANGCSAMASATVTSQNDTEAPTIICPSSMTVSTDEGSNTANVILSDVIVDDNTAVDYYINNYNNTQDASGIYELGVTDVVYTVVDICGNSNSCSFTVTVIDNEEPCIGCDPSNIDNPFDPTAGVSCSTITGTEVSPNEGVSTYTHNGSDWDITANDNVGIASIVYSLSGATMNITQPNTTLDGQVFELGSTTVTWTVTDLSGNFSECSFTVTVSDNEPPAINGNNFDRELTSSSCSFVVPDLTEEIRAVSSDNITANSDLVITQDLSAGYQITTTTMVTVTVRDQSGNETSTTVVLSIPNTPTIMVNSRDVVCQGEMAEATVAVTGGTAPYAYNWSDGTTGATANLMVGSYVVTVTDSNGCSAEYSLSVLESEMPVLLLNADATVLTCSAQMSNITATVSGGTAPYIYTWSNGLTTDSIMVSNVGLYSVTLTDANGCEAMQSIVITEDVNAPMLSIVNNSNTTTLGCSNTEINLMATGGAAYAWSNGVSTAENVITTVGTYSVTATGTNGCTAYETISITEVPGLTIAVNSNDIVCNGGTTEADVSVIGGTAPYIYSWSNGMTTSTANIGAGNYIVTVTDSNGCTAEYSFAVTEPEVFAASITSTSIQCYGESTGSATVTVTGGTAPYTYNWATISSQESTVTGLAAGTYSVAITDANGCNVTQSVTIDQPSMLDVSVTTSATTICSGSSANITATAMGGNPSYMYLWNDGSTTSVIEVTPFSTTTYSLTVTDANGCTAMQNVTVEVSAPLDVMVNSSDLACHGETTDATVVVNGGAEPYVYNWNNGMTTSTANLGAGYYIVTVTDSYGCTAEYSFSVSEPEMLALSLSADVMELTCNTPMSNITAAVIGGTAPYIYTWSDNSTSNTIVANNAGVYNVNVTDANGCNAMQSITITEDVNAPMLSIVNNSNTTTLGCANTEINLMATGGVVYSWSNGVSTAENVITAAGIYYVTATGTNGCTAYEAITITEVPALTIAVNSSNIACHGETTDATVVVNGGTEPYVYNWNNGMTTSTANIGAGDYIVTVTDASGCTATEQISVVEPEALVVNLTAGTITCAEPTVTITATTIGGTVPYSYMWSDGSVANAIEVYADGVYVVTVVDANGCSAVANVDVESTMGITANVSVVNAQNSDIANGAANVAVVGGVAPYRVRMSQETASYEYVFMENSFVISSLPAATYSLAITDANGCVANVNFVIENICNVSIAEQVTDNGTMLHFENVLYPVTVYVDGNTNGTATEDGYMLQNVENGVHNVFVADANGCFANISVFVEGVNCDNVNLMANVSVTPTTSTTNPNGSAVVTAEGGQAPYSFTWSNGNIGDNATDLYQGIYTVVVTDANGCVGTTSFEITYNVPEEEFDELYVTLDYHLEMEQTYTDDGISVIPVAVVYAQAFGGSAPYAYSWMAAGADNGCYFKMYESGSVCVEVRDEQNNAVNGCIYVDVPVTEEISNEIVEEVSQAVDSCFDARFVKAQVLEYAIDTVSGDCVVTWELFDVNGNVHNIDVAYPLDSALSGIYAFNLYFTCNGGRLVTSFSVRLYIEVEGGDPVSVEEIVVSSANAYPNPFTDIINVEIESAVSEDAEISVVNLSGQVVYMTNKHLSAGQNSFEINADNYVPGVYFIRINGSEINETLKMVK